MTSHRPPVPSWLWPWQISGSQGIGRSDDSGVFVCLYHRHTQAYQPVNVEVEPHVERTQPRTLSGNDSTTTLFHIPDPRHRSIIGTKATQHQSHAFTCRTSSSNSRCTLHNHLLRGKPKRYPNHASKFYQPKINLTLGSDRYHS